MQKVLQGTRVFLVPLFQRRYKWAADDWDDLWVDLLAQYDHPDVVARVMREGEGHFLGSIVLHPAPGPASTVSRFLVVDGQQRLTTLLILLAVVRDLRAERDTAWNKAAYDSQYLSNPYNPEHFARLVPTALDQQALQSTLFAGQPTGQPGRAYRFFETRLVELEQRDGDIDFERLETALLLRLLVVDISTSVADNVNHIFHTLNHYGQKLSSLDLIRNHFFMGLGQDSVDFAHANYWEPMESLLGDRDMQRYLWAQVARADAKATQKNLYDSWENRLKAGGRDLDRKQGQAYMLAELQRLAAEAHWFHALIKPEGGDEALTPSAKPLTPALKEHVERLHRWGSQTHLPISLELLSRYGSGRASEDEILRSLSHIESFMVRRGLVGVPTNNLNRIFTGLPYALRDIGARVDEALSEALSVAHRHWPTDFELAEQGPRTALYTSLQTYQVKYILTRLEQQLSPREIADLTEVQVEHVLPQKLSDSWRNYLTGLGDVPERTYTKVHTLGNLTLTGFNQELGNRAFAEKRSLYGASLIALTRDISRSDRWVEETILERAAGLLRLASSVWPGPTRATPASDAPEAVAPDLSSLLVRLPEERWTTVDAIVQFSGRPESDVLAELRRIDAVLAVKVLGPDGSIPDWLEPGRRQVYIDQLSAGGYRTEPPVYESRLPMGAEDLRTLFLAAADSGDLE